MLLTTSEVDQGDMLSSNPPSLFSGTGGKSVSSLTLTHARCRPRIVSTCWSGVPRSRASSGSIGRTRENSFSSLTFGISNSCHSQYVRRAKSMQTLKEPGAASSAVAGTIAGFKGSPSSSSTVAPGSSRLSCMRHVIGFRTYNKLSLVRSRLEGSCDTVEALARRQSAVFPVVLSKVEKSLEELAAAEANYYRETDRLSQYRAKAAEIDYLKANVELCIKESIGVIHQQLAASNYRSRFNSNHTSLANSASPSGVFSNHRPRFDSSWRDHHEHNFFVAVLKQDLARLQDADAASYLDEVQRARDLLAGTAHRSRLRRLIDAEYDTECMQDEIQRLKRVELSVQTSLLRYQGASNILLNVVREAEATTRTLRHRAADAARQGSTEPQRDLAEEEEAIYDFITHGRKIAECEHEKSGGAYNPAGSAKGELKPLPMLPTTPSSDTGKKIQMPVWTQAWTSETRILRSRSPGKQSKKPRSKRNLPILDN